MKTLKPDDKSKQNQDTFIKHRYQLKKQIKTKFESHYPHHNINELKKRDYKKEYIHLKNSNDIIFSLKTLSFINLDPELILSNYYSILSNTKIQTLIFNYFKGIRYTEQINSIMKLTNNKNVSLKNFLKIVYTKKDYVMLRLLLSLKQKFSNKLMFDLNFKYNIKTNWNTLITVSIKDLIKNPDTLNQKFVENLIKLDINPNISDGNGNYPIMLLIRNKHLKLARKLIKNNDFSFDILDIYGESPLTFSLRKGMLNFAKFLINENIALNLANKKKNTPLMISFRKKYFNISKKLIKKGVDCNIRNIYGETPLTHALKKKSISKIYFALKNKIALNTPDKYNNYPITLGFKNNDIKIIRTLLKAGCNINAIERNIDEFIIWAINHNHLKLCNELVKEYINVNKINEYENKAIFYLLNSCIKDRVASRKGSIFNTQKVDNKFTFRNFNVCIKIENESELNSISAKKNQEKSRKIKKENLKYLKNLIQIMIKKGYKFDGSNKYSDSLLTLSLNNQYYDIANAILASEHCNTNFINIKTKHNINTALLLSLENKNFEIARKLIQKGANIFIKSRYNRTVLFYSLEDYELFKYFIKQKIKINHLDIYNQTVFQLYINTFCKNNRAINYKIGLILLKYNANINAKLKGEYIKDYLAKTLIKYIKCINIEKEKILSLIKIENQEILNYIKFYKITDKNGYLNNFLTLHFISKIQDISTILNNLVAS